jgi:large subunit ribosomal protein L25
MAEIQTIAAQARQRAGKGPARADRRAGRIPGVIYGAKAESILITVDPRDLTRELRTGGFLATVYEVKVDGKTERALPRAVQFDPLSDRAIHVDFLRVSAATRVTVEVPVHFLNEEQCPGLRRGGLLNVVRHDVELICRADAIPSHLDVDLTGLDIGDSVHISTIALPEHVHPTITDRDFTIATIAAPTVIQEEAAEVAEAAEVEEGVEAPAEEGVEAPAEEEREGGGD